MNIDIYERLGGHNACKKKKKNPRVASRPIKNPKKTLARKL